MISLKTPRANADFEIFKLLIDLWSRENPIKTNKLQVLLVVNGLLLTAVNVGGGFIAKNWPIYLGGAILSLIWVLSIGRTSLFQEIWQLKLQDLARKYPDDEHFRIMTYQDYLPQTSPPVRLSGCVSSKYYLIGAPILFCLTWFCLFFYFKVLTVG
jgi:hypothetical protein